MPQIFSPDVFTKVKEEVSFAQCCSSESLGGGERLGNEHPSEMQPPIPSYPHGGVPVPLPQLLGRTSPLANTEAQGRWDRKPENGRNQSRHPGCSAL